jgi:hypothetical protein
MKTTGISFVIILIVSIMTSCTPASEKKAETDFLRVESMVTSHELSNAMQMLDSMMVWNKDNYGVVGKALKRKNAIALDYHKGVIQMSEERIRALDSQVEALSKGFIFKPGQAGQPGSYEHKRQTVESSWNRTFLKIVLNEKGDAWMLSHYYGKEWIDHTSLRIYDDKNYILTDTIGLGHEWNRKVEDLGDRWETIEFRDGSDAGALAFIHDNYRKSIKVKFTGKTFQYILMENYDKEAIKNGWELAQVLKERFGLRETIELNQAELRKL